jgi:hypothetical protein
VISRAVVVLVFLVACGDDDGGAPDARLAPNGCPVLEQPLAAPGDPIDGDTWDTFAEDFFATWCVRCHSSTLTGTARNGAPEGFNWDVEASVREHLPMIRAAVGVDNIMPFTPPDPTCDERARLVRWIDGGAP